MAERSTSRKLQDMLDSMEHRNKTFQDQATMKIHELEKAHSIFRQPLLEMENRIIKMEANSHTVMSQLGNMQQSFSSQSTALQSQIGVIASNVASVKSASVLSTTALPAVDNASKYMAELEKLKNRD